MKASTASAPENPATYFSFFPVITYANRTMMMRLGRAGSLISGLDWCRRWSRCRWLSAPILQRLNLVSNSCDFLCRCSARCSSSSIGVSLPEVQTQQSPNFGDLAPILILSPAEIMKSKIKTTIAPKFAPRFDLGAFGGPNPNKSRGRERG